MEDNKRNRQPHHQKKYRQSQQSKGLVRFELQVNADAKARFEQLVAEVANEYPEPWDPRRRHARARAQVFEEITKGVLHEFFTLKEQIDALKVEIKALSPQFFKSTPDNMPLPEAIQALPNDPLQLKSILAQTHHTAQQAQRDKRKYQQLAQQFETLYETVSQYNEELKSQLG